MISAVVPPRPIAQPQLPPAVSAAPTSVRDRAAAGYFRDLALWLNEPLVNQGIFVQVQADDRPGCLKLTVEFERSPMQDRLTRFLCHRIWQLNSEFIEGIYILARPVGWQRVLWKQRIKISTPALRRRQANEQLTQSATKAGSLLPPSLRSPRRRAKSHQPFSQRFKTLRTVMLSGSAVAAFVFGCLLEVMLSGPSPSLPSFSAQAPESRVIAEEDSTFLKTGAGEGMGTATDTPSRSPSLPSFGDTGSRAEVAIPVSRSSTDAAAPADFPRSPRTPGSAPRPSVVDTALEPVAVIPHNKTSPVPSDQVTMIFGGDISLDDLNFDQIEAEGGFFADVEAYFNADVSLVNLATPMATAATSLNEEFQQRTRPEAARMLANSGIDIVNLTHSNLMQYGAEGLTETLTALDSNGLYRVGAGRNATEARRPEILEVKGKRIAYLSYAMGGNNAAIDTSALKERAGSDNETVAQELENFKRSTAFEERAGFNAQNMPEIVQDIQAIRDQVDWIVVNFRWVDHLEETPNFVQTNLARLAIDQGADVVVGYHPTVVQGGEIYKGRPIAYSLGDFVFSPDQPLQDQDSAVLKVALKEDQMQVEFVPVRIRDSLPQTLTGDDGQAVLQRIQNASAQFETPLKPSVVLDLKAPAMPSPESLDPNSPFVNPNAEDSLILEANPAVDVPVEETIKEDGELKEAQPSDSAAEETPTELDNQPSDTLDLPLPAGEPGLDLQQIDQDLQEWGPKVAPKEQEFRPVPQNRSGAEDPALEAQAQPDLLQRLLDSLRPANPDSSAMTDPWSDTVPAVPTPAAPMQVAPTPLDLQPEVEKAGSETEPKPTAATQVPMPPSRPAPAVPTETPAPAVTAAPTVEETDEAVETVPEAAFPEEDSAEEESLSVEMEKAMPDTKVIPPQAEPLVGPLSFADDDFADDVSEAGDDLTDDDAIADPVALGRDAVSQPSPVADAAETETAETDSPVPDAPTAEVPENEPPVVVASSVESLAEVSDLPSQPSAPEATL